MPRTGLPGAGERNRARGPVLIVLHHERRQIVHFGVTHVRVRNISRARVVCHCVQIRPHASRRWRVASAAQG